MANDGESMPVRPKAPTDPAASRIGRIIPPGRMHINGNWGMREQIFLNKLQSTYLLLLYSIFYCATGLSAPLAVGAIPPGDRLMIVEAHHDDHTWQWGFGGLTARMTDEGYEGILVRVSNDEKDGDDGYAHNDMVNLRECEAAVAHIGVDTVLSLNWRNDYMDATPLQELRAQLVLLIRKHRPDVLMAYDPWGHYDRNPDHRKVSRAVAEAYWMAGYANIHPEHLLLGLKPHRVPHIYFTQRGDYGKGHEPNVAVPHTAAHVRRKAEAMVAHRNIYHQPETARRIREELREQRLQVPELEGLTDGDAIDQIEKWYMYWSSERYGRENGLAYAEVFYQRSEWDHLPGLSGYIGQNAIDE